MSLWNKISLFKFQQIEAIDAKKDMEDIDKSLFSTCIVFGMTEYQLDNTSARKALRMIKKVSKIFSAPFAAKVFKRIGRYDINYEPATMTLGQYIELNFWLSVNPIQNAHYVFATVTDRTEDHRTKANYFLQQPITRITGSLGNLIEKFIQFNGEYKELFGLGGNVDSDTKTDIFNKRYGWQFSASQVAEYERINLEQAYDLPIRQALNDLAYLKEKSRYDAEQLKRN